MTSGSDGKLGARHGRDTWTTPQRVNQDGPWNEHPEYYDQFMPRIAVDDSATGTDDRIDIIWYDTRNDPNPADLNPPWFSIDLYYAYATDSDGTGDLTFTESKVAMAIDTGALIQNTQQFIGDYNALVVSKISSGRLVVPVYMGTLPPPEGGPDDPEPEEPVFDDTIFSNRITHANP